MSAWTMTGVDEWTVPGYAEERLLGRGVAGRVARCPPDFSSGRPIECHKGAVLCSRMQDHQVFPDDGNRQCAL